jgi:Bacterial CdiA-CT RNAse A domain
MDLRKTVQIVKRAAKALLLFWTLTAGCGQAPAPSAGPSTVEAPKSATAPTGVRQGYDLARDEERGGHTVNKHVGRSDEQLRERLGHEHISAASTWTDIETAETTVAEALRAKQRRIDNWIRRGYPRANLALHYDARRTIGRSLRRGDEQTVDCTRAVIVLRADGPDTFYVLTTYPEDRE